MFPTLGRIVHYTSPDNKEEKVAPIIRAAIIAEVQDTGDPHGHKHDCTEHCAKVSLTIFYPDLQMWMENVPFSEKPFEPGHWNWPPRK